MSFTWAKNYPEVHKVCSLFNLTELDNPLKYSYRPLQGFIQDGPQCGLVALAMYIGSPSKESVELLFQAAKSAGYTNNGEMFSAKCMADLAQSQLKSTSAEVHSGLLDTNEIKRVLLDGGSLLVPYDSDKDNSPCLLNGHKAHWAVICGAVETKSDFYVLARHGKARNVAVWRLADLSDSNAQLNEEGVYEKAPGAEFKLPDGGIGGPLGLKCKSVVLRDL